MANHPNVAFITGAARGIGAETARALVARGIAVAVTARQQAAADAVAARISMNSGEAVGIACDVTDVGSIDTAVAAAARALGRPTILINNAGAIEPQGPFHETDPVAWAHSIAVNLVGAANVARAVLPGMLAARRGTIINVSSGAAHRPVRGWSAYCAAKAGLAMLTRSLDKEYRGNGVSAVSFAPGLVDTDMQGAIRAAAVNEVANIPQAKLAHAGEPAAAIAFLCSGGAERFAGEDIDVRDESFRKAAGLGSALV